MINLLLNDCRGTIAPELYGTLIENTSTLMEGIWVGDDPSIPNDDGLRLDTIEAFRQLGISLVRFPGGTGADYYRWRDGIGPRSKRPRTWQFFFGNEDSNEFGTDEFMRFCETIGAVSSIKINPITAPLHETLDWMQYCNYDGNTDLANERRENGHPQPYGVKSWIIGNETSDTYSPENYADRVFEWTFYMRQVDPAAKIIATGGIDDWNERFLKRFAELSESGGLASNNPVKVNNKGFQPGFKVHMLELVYPNEERIQDAIAWSDKYFGEGNLEFCVGEYEGMIEHWWPEEWTSTLSTSECVLMAGQTPDIPHESDARLDGALMAVEKMHLFMRYAKRIKMASFLYPTNCWAPWIKTSGPKFVRTPHYHAFDILKEHLRAETIGVELNSTDGLDVMASLTKDGRQLTVSLLNQQEGKTVDADMRLKDDEGRLPHTAAAKVLTGNPADQNTFDVPDTVIPQEAKVEIKNGELSVTCKPVSLTVVTCNLAK